MSLVFEQDNPTLFHFPFSMQKKRAQSLRMATFWRSSVSSFPMNSEAQNLISRANAIVEAVTAKGGRRRRYPPPLKAIVRALIVKHRFSISQAVSLIPVSRTSDIKWSAPIRPKRPSGKTKFKKISVKHNRKNIVDYLPGITIVLGCLIVAQALSLAFSLFLR